MTAPTCNLCGTQMIATRVANVFACQNCDLYPYISQPMTKQARMNQQSIAQTAVENHRRGVT